MVARGLFGDRILDLPDMRSKVDAGSSVLPDIQPKNVIISHKKRNDFLRVMPQLLTSVNIMVFILDGCSFHYAHTWSKSDISIC